MTTVSDRPAEAESSPEGNSSDHAKPPSVPAAPETSGRGGLDPTRYGDWEKNGRCIDF